MKKAPILTDPARRLITGRLLSNYNAFHHDSPFTGTAIYDPQTQQFVGIPQFCSEASAPCVASTEFSPGDTDTYDVFLQISAGAPTVGLQQLLDLFSL